MPITTPDGLFAVRDVLFLLAGTLGGFVMTLVGICLARRDKRAQTTRRPEYAERLDDVLRDLRSHRGVTYTYDYAARCMIAERILRAVESEYPKLNANRFKSWKAAMEWFYRDERRNPGLLAEAKKSFPSAAFLDFLYDTPARGERKGEWR